METTESITHLVTSLDLIQELMGSLNLSFKGQEERTMKIDQNTEEVAKISEDNAAAATEFNMSLKEMLKAIEVLSKMAEELKNEFSKFEV